MTTRERLEDFLKTPYPPDDEIWAGFLAAIASEIDDHDGSIDDILVEKFVESATGEQLNKLAEFYQVQRRTGEPLESFRARIKSALRSQITSATLGEIRDVVAVLLEVETADVDVDEPYDLEPMHINLDVADQLDQVEMTAAEFIDTVDDMVAVGVSIGILVSSEHEDAAVVSDGSEVGHDSEAADELALEDDGWHRTDEIQQSHWGSGRWDIDFWNTALFEFELTRSSSLAMASSGAVDEEPSASSSLAVADPSDARIEPVETSHWDEGRWNVDAYA